MKTPILVILALFTLAFNLNPQGENPKHGKTDSFINVEVNNNYSHNI